MRIKHVVLLLLTVLYLSACNSGGNDFTVVGDITNMPAQQVVLEELSMT
jgi:hypothetical protein